jgi:Type IV secretion-system coupling protein DNA-binding domain
MRTCEDGSTFRFRAPDERELRGRLYRALARELVAAPGASAVVFESSTDRPVPDVTVLPAELVGAVRAAPAFRSLRASPWGAPPPGGPDTQGWEATWTFSPTDPMRPLSVTPEVWDVPEELALLGPDGTLDVQTFWLSGRSDGRLWTARRVRLRAGSEGAVEARSPAVERFTAAEWSRASGVVCHARPLRVSDRDWTAAASRSLPRDSWFAVATSIVDRTAEPVVPETPRLGPMDEGHTIALGASGAGKTTFLAERAAREIRRGGSVVAVDLHGDLAPAIVARLPRADRERVVAVDAARRPVVGVAALAGRDDRAAAHLVAAVKRLSPDGNDVYWGFRLERIFDAFVRLVQESGGTLGDLYALLTDADRRDSARLATRSEELARFLDELGPIVRRTPEFLWAAAARLAKIVLIPELSELLSPEDGGVPVEDLLESGRSLLVRIPFSSVGPEAATFAGSLVLARTYLGVASRRGPTGAHRPVAVVLDEVQGLSPRLVAEMLTEGRKFGLRLALASQFPERLAPELRLAAAGVSRGVVVFRVPRANAAAVGGWLGVPPAEAERVLPELPVGVGVVRAPGSGELRSVLAAADAGAQSEERWSEAVQRTLQEFQTTPAEGHATVDEATERLLLGILSCEERGAPVGSDSLVGEAVGIPGPTIDRAVLADRASTLGRCGLAGETDGAWHLTPAGERRLGLRAVTGASKESAEHRLLLLRTFRLFARHGHLLEIVRQGRYDTTLPDAVYRQIPERCRNGSPRTLAEAIAAAQRGWAWRFFGGQDVHVEAEVTGALRPARIRHGLAKATARGAFALFVVGDAARAARVRKTLRAEGASPQQAQVWTLSRNDEVPPRDGKAPGRSPPPCGSSSRST